MDRFALVPVRLSCVLLAVCGMLFSGHVPASGRDGGKGLPFSYVWERVQMDGSRTGVVCPSAGDVPESLGRMDGRIYVSPSGQVFGPGIVADVAGVVTDAQTVMAPVKKVVGYSPVAMKAEYPESALSNLFVDRVMDAVGEVSGRKVDVGIVNFGGIRVDMPEGDILVDDIMSMFPFKNTIVYVSLKGSRLREILDGMAADVFHTWLVGTYYMNPILDPDKSTGGEGGYKPGGICGYYDYEQIHDDLALHAAVVYDFAYDYLKAHPHPHLQELGMSLPEVSGIVFKRFIDIGFVRGGKSGNWNVNGWNMMLRPILALEENDAYPDGKGRSYYLHYLIKESTPYHDAIPDILKAYDPVTGLWPESPGYAFGTVAGLLDFAALLQREGIDVLKENPILQKAALAVFPWMDERGNMIVFGDSRGGSANFTTLERLLAYYQLVGNKENAMRVASALQTGISSGNYRREEADWSSLCLYASAIPPVNTEEMAEERMSYSPFHRLVTMKSRRI